MGWCWPDREPPPLLRSENFALVPIDEIERPIIELRNPMLFYSTVFLGFVLPLYATLIVAWIDRSLGATIRRYPSHDGGS
jgi:hypothetical protein